MQTLEEVRKIVAATLDLGSRGERLKVDSELLGSLPELDSMAVMSIVTALEERFDIVVDDDDISAKTFSTLGSLSDFVDQKMSA